MQVVETIKINHDWIPAVIDEPHLIWTVHHFVSLLSIRWLYPESSSPTQLANPLSLSSNLFDFTAVFSPSLEWPPFLPRITPQCHLLNSQLLKISLEMSLSSYVLNNLQHQITLCNLERIDFS